MSVQYIKLLTDWVLDYLHLAATVLESAPWSRSVLIAPNEPHSSLPNESFRFRTRHVARICDEA